MEKRKDPDALTGTPVAGRIDLEFTEIKPGDLMSMSKLTPEAERAIKEINDNIRYARANAHLIRVD